MGEGQSEVCGWLQAAGGLCNPLLRRHQKVLLLHPRPESPKGLEENARVIDMRQMPRACSAVKAANFQTRSIQYSQYRDYARRVHKDD